MNAKQHLVIFVNSEDANNPTTLFIDFEIRLLKYDPHPAAAVYKTTALSNHHGDDNESKRFYENNNSGSAPLRYTD